MAPTWSRCRVCGAEFRGRSPGDTVCRKKDEAHARELRK